MIENTEITTAEADAAYLRFEALPDNPLLILGGVIAGAQITEKMGEPNEIYTARGCIAGVVMACRQLLPPA